MNSPRKVSIEGARVCTTSSFQPSAGASTKLPSSFRVRVMGMLTPEKYSSAGRSRYWAVSPMPSTSPETKASVISTLPSQLPTMSFLSLDPPHPANVSAMAAISSRAMSLIPFFMSVFLLYRMISAGYYIALWREKQMSLRAPDT